MSGQMADVIVIDDEEFAIVEPEPGMLFDPRAHGLRPVMTHTANTRGVYARYRLDHGRLMLSDLQVGHLEAPPAIAGIEPATDDYGQVWTYLGLSLPIDWTGDLLVGTDLIDELYIHAGFSPVWHYERVLAFDIENGVVVGSDDRSSEVAEYREARIGGYGGAGGEDDDNAFERLLEKIKLRFAGASDDEE